MVYYLITTLHVLVCIILILVVLLQSGKGADLASAFGGGATQTAFGSRGPASFLSKLTTVAAIVFMVTSTTLAMLTTKREGAKSILETTSGTKAPQRAPAAKTQAPAPAPTPEQIRQRQMQIEAKQAQPAQGQPVTPVPGQGTAKSSPPAESPTKSSTPPPAGKKP